MLYNSRVRILRSSLKHSIREGEIQHAYENAITVTSDIDSNINDPADLYIGPDFAGNLIELLLVERDGEIIIFHAMRLRTKFAALLNKYIEGEEQ